jgi:hypothetical protein
MSPLLDKCWWQSCVAFRSIGGDLVQKHEQKECVDLVDAKAARASYYG